MAVTDPDFNPSGDPGISAIKKAANAFADVIEQHAPNCRRRDIALDQLEAASMFAVKAAAVGDA